MTGAIMTLCCITFEIAMGLSFCLALPVTDNDLNTIGTNVENVSPYTRMANMYAFMSLHQRHIPPSL